MVLVAVFGVALLVAVLLSGLAARTVLSTPLLFLAGGALVSDGFLHLIHIKPDSGIVSVTADLALFAVLFTDGMHVSLPNLRANWKNPARALGAVFSAGAVLAQVSPEAKACFEPLGEALAELAKSAALLVFGVLLAPQPFGDLSLGGYAAVILAIFLIRPASLLLSLLGTRISRREKLVAAWFGPKGFASVVYGLLVLQSGIPQAKGAFTLVAVCIAFSIIAHSSTDVPIARAFDVEDLAGIPAADDTAGTARIPATPTAEGNRGT